MTQRCELALRGFGGEQRKAPILSVGDREGTFAARLLKILCWTGLWPSAARFALASGSILLLAFAMLATPATSSASAQIGIGVSVTIAPPPLPVYTQPICPGPGYIWTPGYWAYDPDDGYYWVPGTWVTAPSIGVLWTPGYWGWSGAAFVWNAGYWGPTVGFYGGINYGFGYTGVGYG